MKDNHAGLRQQLIDAMASGLLPRLNGMMNEKPLSETIATEIFDAKLWPILESAIDAGEVLFARPEAPQPTISNSIIAWMKRVTVLAFNIECDKHTLSRAKAIKLLIGLGEQAERALKDAEAINHLPPSNPST